MKNLTSTSTTSTHTPDICPPHHVPYVISQPVDDRITAADKLQMFSLGGLFCHQENYKTCRHKGHGHNNEDGNHHIGPLKPEETEERLPECSRNRQSMLLSNIQIIQREAGTGPIHWVVCQCDA